MQQSVSVKSVESIAMQQNVSVGSVAVLSHQEASAYVVDQEKDDLINILRSQAAAQRAELEQLRLALSSSRTQDEQARKGEQDIERLQREVQERRHEVRRLREALLGENGQDAAAEEPGRSPPSVSYPRHCAGPTYGRGSREPLEAAQGTLGQFPKATQLRTSRLSKPQSPRRSNGGLSPRASPQGRSSQASPPRDLRSWDLVDKVGKGTLVRPSANPTSTSPTPRPHHPPRLEQPPWRPAGYLDPLSDQPPTVDGSQLSSRCSSPRRTPAVSRESSPTSRQRSVPAPLTPVTPRCLRDLIDSAEALVVVDSVVESVSLATTPMLHPRGVEQGVSVPRESRPGRSRSPGRRSRSTSREDLGRHCILVPPEEDIDSRHNQRLLEPPDSPGLARSVLRSKVFCFDRPDESGAELSRQQSQPASDSVGLLGNTPGTKMTQRRLIARQASTPNMPEKSTPSSTRGKGATSPGGNRSPLMANVIDPDANPYAPEALLRSQRRSLGPKDGVFMPAQSISSAARVLPTMQVSPQSPLAEWQGMAPAIGPQGFAFAGTSPRGLSLPIGARSPAMVGRPVGSMPLGNAFGQTASSASLMAPSIQSYPSMSLQALSTAESFKVLNLLPETPQKTNRSTLSTGAASTAATASAWPPSPSPASSRRLFY